MRLEGLRGVELEQRKIVGEEFICNLEKGPILGESDEDEERRSKKKKLNYLNSSNQQEKLMSKASNETTNPCDFKADILCMTVGLINNGQPLKIVTKMEKNGQNMNYVLQESEIALSHEDCQRKTHTQSKKKISERKVQKYVSAENRVELAHAHNQKKEKYNESLTSEERDFMEELKLLDYWMVEDTHATYGMDDTNSVQGNFAKLFEELIFLAHRIEIKKIHIQYEELKLEEEIVSRDNNGDEATKNNQQVIKGEMFEPEFSKSFVTLILKESMQQMEMDSKFQSRTELDKVIKEIRILMLKIPERMHTNVKRAVNNREQLTVQDIFSKVSGQLQYKVWKPRRKKITSTRDILQQHEATSDRIQFKVWDPGRRLMTRRS